MLRFLKFVFSLCSVGAVTVAVVCKYSTPLFNQHAVTNTDLIINLFAVSTVALSSSQNYQASGTLPAHCMLRQLLR
jgi:hypothetical protein